MRARSSLRTLSTLHVSLVLAFSLGACAELQAPTFDLPAPSDGSSAPGSQNDCFMSVMYLVEGDTFTMMSAGAESFDIRGSVQDETGIGWNPDVEPRAKYQADLDRGRGGYEGFARLYWDDVLVGEALLDNDFAFGSEPVVVAYEDADGTRVEVHAYAQPDCTSWPEEVMTRAEIEALER
jgi:hypothetical protein